jgi:hypothetical protein
MGIRNNFPLAFIISLAAPFHQAEPCEEAFSYKASISTITDQRIPLNLGFSNRI